ncbi:hypothetical protein C1646_765190 [Rhizophagus diaphanus]|nr:hypothetical protein C1646_765190 [Rhizophagus diaphanus] [Rhizophagus sp. MUCL 43196]
MSRDHEYFNEILRLGREEYKNAIASRRIYTGNLSGYLMPADPALDPLRHSWPASEKKRTQKQIHIHQPNLNTGTVVNGGTVNNINSGVKLMTRRDQDESDDDFMPIHQQKRKKNKELELHKESVCSVPKKAKTSRNEDIETMILTIQQLSRRINFSRSRSKNTSPSSNSQYSEIAGSNRGTQIKTTKGPSAPVFSESKSQCLDKSPIEEADEQISSADETNMII